MSPGRLLSLLGALADTHGRAEAARALAEALGADELIVLLVDPDVDALLPAAGLRKTLPGGPSWREFLQRCRDPGLHHAQLPWSPAVTDVTDVTDVTACCSGRLALIVLGARLPEADAALLLDALPLLDGALSTAQALGVARGELAAAHAELVQAASVTRALDDARREVDRTLVELDARTRALEIAREQAEDAMRAKDQFLAMLGHELRNPLAPIVTALELVRLRGHWTPEHDVMQRQVDHMLRLVDDLLDVTRIATGKLALELGPVPLDAVVANAVESVRPLLEPGRPVAIDVPAGIVVRGDPHRLEQVFCNLLTNAIKYSDPTTPIAVVARDAGKVAAVDIVDHGIGIEPAHLETVFELFEQQGRGIDRAQGGLGLGLAIVRNVVQLHGGRVCADSAGPGCGSRFTVELPLVDEVARPAQPPTAQAPSVTGGRVLLVDDNVDALMTLSMALEFAGYDVCTAGDGPSALQAASTFRPEAAVLDIGLPGMDGYELACALRETALMPLRLVALTGYGEAKDRQQAADAGFDAHLVKPTDLDTLMTTLTTLLGGASPDTQVLRPH